MKNSEKYYRKYTEKEIDGLEKNTSIFVIFVEIASDGMVLREVGFDNKGNVVHKCPSENYKHGTYGLFDLARVDVESRKNDLTKTEFEELWNK